MTINHTNNELNIDLTIRWQTWGEEGLPADFERRLQLIGTFSMEALARLVELSGELERNLERRAPRGAVDHFMAASIDWVDYLDRMATVRTLEYLGQPRMKPVSWLRRTSPDAHSRRRILTGIEDGLVCFSSLSSWRRTGPVGALDSGMASGELGLLSTSGVLRDDSGTVTHLQGAGTMRATTCGYPAAVPRTMQIARWAQSSFTELVSHAQPDELLLYGGTSEEPTKIQSLILMNVGKALATAGLAGDPTVTPLSIRNTAARRIHDSSGLEAASAFLGHKDFDSVAREIGIRPHLAKRSR